MVPIDHTNGMTEYALAGYNIVSMRFSDERSEVWRSGGLEAADAQAIFMLFLMAAAHIPGPRSVRKNRYI